MAKLANSSVKRAVPFEEALTLAGYGKFNWFLLLAAGGNLMCVIIETMSMMFIVPSSQCDLQLSLSEKGLLSSISFFGVVSSSYIWGFLADTRGRKKILVASLVSSAIISFFCSIVPWSWLFIILRFLNGALIGGASSIIYAYAGEFHNNHYRPKVVSWIATFVAFGNMYLPGLAWLILPEQWDIDLPLINLNFRPWRLLLIIYALPSLIFAFCLYILPESPKYLLTQGKYEEVLQILKTMFRINTGKPEEEFLVSEILWDELSDPNHEKEKSLWQIMKNQTLPLFKKPFLGKTLMVSTLQFCIFFSTSGLIMWYPEILNSMSAYSNEVSKTDVSLCKSLIYEETQELLHENFTKPKVCRDNVDTDVFSTSIVLGAAYAITYIVIGSIINLVGKKTLLILFIVITTAPGFCSQFIYGYTWIQFSVGMFLLAGAGIGIVNAIVVDLYPTQIRAMALAVSLMLGRFGAMAGSNAYGPLIYNYCDYLFYIVAIDHLIVIVVVFLLPRNQKIPPMIEPVV